MNKLRVALIHDYLNQYGGAEKTLEALMEIFPEAPIYTGIYTPKAVSKKINERHIISPKSSLFAAFPKHCTFLMPFVFEGFDLREFDIVISDGTAWPKGVLTTPNQLHISYIHTPPRFLYKYSVESQNRSKWYYKPFVMLIDHYLRIWDFAAAQRPDFVLANSLEIKKRIQKFYKRDAQVIYPPVEIDSASSGVSGVPHGNNTNYYLAAGRLSKYKNFDLIIKAFSRLGLPLHIIGTGIEESKLKKAANDNIKFLGRVPEEEKLREFQNCRGFIFPVVDEDFGIVNVEALAQGKPVLAHKSGGPMEIVKSGVNGMFFQELNEDCLVQSIKEFDELIERGAFNPQMIKDSVQRFAKERFKKEFQAFVQEKWEAKNAGAS